MNRGTGLKDVNGCSEGLYIESKIHMKKCSRVVEQVPDVSLNEMCAHQYQWKYRLLPASQAKVYLIYLGS